MKLTKKLLAMALAGVMLLTILTGCSSRKSGDRLVEEYMAAFLSEHAVSSNIPITHDVPEIKTVAEKFDPSWLDSQGNWTISKTDSSPDKRRQALKDVFSNYENNYNVFLYACEVDSKQSELHQTMRVMPLILGGGLPLHSSRGRLTAVKCATRLVTRGEKSYRIAVIIYDRTAG